MSQLVDDSKRRVIPRWRDSADARRLSETSSLRKPINPGVAEPVKRESLDRLARDWHYNKSLPFANDLIGAAVVLGELEIAQEAASFVLQNRQSVSNRAARLALKVLDKPNTFAEVTNNLDVKKRSQKRVSALRSRLNTRAGDPIAWADLSRQYSILGSSSKADRAMKIALGLAPDHRYIMRVASRLYHHQGDYDKALQILRKSTVTEGDPWLTGAEIAISGVANRNPKFVRKGRTLLESGGFSDFHISELAASLGSLEFASGSDRRAKQHFRTALQDPTENTLAQAKWVERHKLGFDEESIRDMPPSAHEAHAWVSLLERDYRLALEFAGEWVLDEPFSSRSTIFASVIASVALEDYEKALMFGHIALLANSSEFLVLNNQAFILASANRTAEAEVYLHKMDELPPSVNQRAVLLATKGLIEYRKGNSVLGKRYYDESILIARNINDDNILLRALTFRAREEMNVNGKLTEDVTTELRKLVDVASDPILEPLIDKLLKVAG